MSTKGIKNKTMPMANAIVEGIFALGAPVCGAGAEGITGWSEVDSVMAKNFN